MQYNLLKLICRPDKFKTYKPSESSFDMGELQAKYDQITQTSDASGLINDLEYYRKLLKAITSNPRCDIRKMKDLKAPIQDGKIALGLRHDIDQNFAAATRASKLLHEFGISGSFYVLHTAFYYGTLEGRIFNRNQNIIPHLLSMQDQDGNEIGLHTDGLWVYQQWGLDGAHAVKSELKWLRSHNLNIFGTAAHGSAPVYGAENYEIFKGRAVFDRKLLVRNEQIIPLQVLDEERLELVYEANYPKINKIRKSLSLSRYLSSVPNDAVRNEEWMNTYLLNNPYCRWGVDYAIWLLAKDKWVISATNGLKPTKDNKPIYIWNANLSEVIQFINQIPDGKSCVMCVHPVYISG